MVVVKRGADPKINMTGSGGGGRSTGHCIRFESFVYVFVPKDHI